MSNNMKAFLLMIRKSEGTASENGYRYLFGSKYGHEKLFVSYSDHPKLYFDYTNKAGAKLRTSAAGAYQIIYSTWVALKNKLNLKDFTPASQDLAAIELIRECKALEDVEAGLFNTALNKVRKIWASLPGSGNNQPERTLAVVTEWYKDAGGQVADLV